jgi:Lrp/AsnC family leucine-responsive transcriptional regulator
MRLTDKESDILACVELRADLPIDQIKKETGYQEHTIRYHLHQLEERGVIRRRPAINMGAAGYNGVGVFFSPSPESNVSFEALRKHLLKVREITWASEFSGDFHFGISFTVVQMGDVEIELQKLSAKFPNLFYEKMVSTKFRAVQFPRRYLSSSSKIKVPPLVFSRALKPAPLDDTDRKVLGALTHESYRSRRELSQKIAIPLSTLDGRVKRLEEKGILSTYVYDINPSLLGIQGHTLLIFCKGLNPKLSKELFEFAERHSQITHLYSCLGSWDFELNVEVRSSEEIRNIVEELYTEFRADINSVKVLSKAPNLKYTYVPF